MAEYRLKLLFEAFDKVSQPLGRVARGIDAVARRVKNSAIGQHVDAINRRLDRTADLAYRAGKRLRDIGGEATKYMTVPLTLVGGLALNAAGRMEQLTVAFTSMLGGSAERAKAMVTSLADFAASTPFQLEGIGGAAKQLLAFGVDAANIIERLTMLGDISAGAGVPLNEMAAIFGKVKAKGKAMTEELLQLSDRGVPIIDTLAARMKVPKEAIFDLASKGRISFEVFTAALASMREKGGIFVDQMKKQSGTLFGLVSTFKDNVFNAMASLGDRMVVIFNIKDRLAALTDWVQRTVKAMEGFAENYPTIAKMLFLLAALAAAAGPLLIMLGWMSTGLGAVATGMTVLAPLFSAVIVGITGVGAAIANFVVALKAGYSAFAALQLAFAANPFGLILIAVAALAAAAYLIYDNWSTIAAFFGGLWDDITAGFEKGVINGILNLLATFNPIVLFAKGINRLVDYLFGVDLAKIGAEWMAGFGEGFEALWANITAGFEEGVINGILNLIATFNPIVLFAKGINRLVDYLFGIDLAKIGAEWMAGLGEGFSDAWDRIVAWLTDAVDGLLDWMPDWVREKMDMSGPGGGLRAPEFAAAVPSALAPAAGGGRQRGEIAVRFENAPTSMRVERVRSESPDLDIGVETGHAMAGS